jgi:hypothetical protein
MSNPILKSLFLATSFIVITAYSWAHVPYFEYDDFTMEQPYKVTFSIEQSLAIYAWLGNNTPDTSADVDVLVFELNDPANVYLEVIVPVCPGYEEFRPWIALAGPGLPEPKTPLPFDIPAGYGIEVIQDVNKGKSRDAFYEIFGGKSYYYGPVYDEHLSLPGTYYIFVWEPRRKSGDYVAVVGKKEIWRFEDIIRAIRNTPLIRLDQELHVDCSNPQMENWWELGPATR